MLQAMPSMMGPLDSIYIRLGNGRTAIPFTYLCIVGRVPLVSTKVSNQSSAVIPEGSLYSFHQLVADAQVSGPSQLSTMRLVFDFVYVSLI